MLIVILISSVPVFLFYTAEQIFAFAIGAVVSFINAITGFFMNTFALKKRMSVFMAYVFGGMGLRMLFIAIVLLLLTHHSNLDNIALISSVLIFYFLFISIEIYFLNKLVSTKRKLNNESLKD